MQNVEERQLHTWLEVCASASDILKVRRGEIELGFLQVFLVVAFARFLNT